MPPQETGLTCNSWYGKFHLEMHYWHAAHFASWGRPHSWSAASAGTTRSYPRAREKAKAAGLHRRALAQDDRAGRPRQPFPHRPAAHLAAAASHRHGGADLRRAPNARHRWHATATSSSNPPSSWRPTRTTTRRLRATYSGPPVIPAAGKSPAARNLEPHLRTRVLGPRPGHRAALARARRACPASPSGTKSAPNSPRFPSRTASTWRTRTARRPSRNAIAITPPCWARSACCPAARWIARPCAAP